MPSDDSIRLQPDVNELILCNDKNYTCETYIFEPSSHEQSLGRLLAVAETEERDGVGSELLDLAMTAIQREYYRDPSRGAVSSFESALHQANLVLHDSSEQGVRDWMGYFNVVVGVLVNNILHISVSGEALTLLCRKSHVTNISYGLSHLPITNPLRTFSQVASGTIAARDIIFFGTSQFDTAFPHSDLVRLSVDHSASTIGLRLRQLYTDRKLHNPVAGLTISILPQHISEPRREMNPDTHRRSIATMAIPPIRKPLIIHTSRLKSILALVLQLTMSCLRYASQYGKKAAVYASHATRKGVTSLAKRKETPASSFMSKIAAVQKPLRDLPSWPKRILPTIKDRLTTLPKSSRIFAILTVILAIAFVSSLLLLRHRRTEDQHIQRASEILHEAETKQEAAASALIYNNREQAQKLLNEADGLAKELQATGLYTNEVNDLSSKITQQRDRLQRIVRVNDATTTVVADLSKELNGTALQRIFFANNALYTYNPATNAIIKIDPAGAVSVVQESTENIGFFIDGAAHEADKTIILLTKDAGLALFDTKNTTITKQDISLPAATSDIGAIAPYGTRLYVYEKSTKNIYAYSKSLRGYTSGEPWIKATDFPTDTIKSIAVDGSIYTLHTDGQINKLFKGEKVEFKVDSVTPALSSPNRLFTSEASKFIYVLDPAEKRVVIFDKKGVLQRQIYLTSSTNLTDISLSADEKTLYALDEERIISINLVE